MRELVHNVIARWRLYTCPFIVNLPHRIKSAAKISELFQGIDDGVSKRSGDVTVRLKKHPLPFEWEFMATSGKDKYTVSVRAYLDMANPDRKLVKNADILLSCSCPYWRWQGPEYHAKKGGYLYGPARGTASTPDIRDPERDNYLCKHAVKVLETMRNYTIGE